MKAAPEGQWEKGDRRGYFTPAPGHGGKSGLPAAQAALKPLFNAAANP